MSDVDLQISGRTALVLGAGGGIGGGIADALAAEGVAVAAADRDEDAAQVTVERIRTAGGTAEGFTVTLGEHDTESRLVEGVLEKLGQVDILVNNTGGPPPTPVAGVSMDLWREHFESMLASVFHLTDRVLPGMLERGWGRLVTSTSSGVISPIAGLGISNTLRASLHSWSKTLATEVGADGVTSNVIVPGRIATPRAIEIDTKRAGREGRSPEDVKQSSESTIPVGRYGSPEEYGAAVAFLASGPAGFINGNVLRVDGGMIASV